MKKIILIAFLFQLQNYHCQWLEEDSTNLIMTDFDSYDSHFFNSSDGFDYYCGLSIESDNPDEKYKTIYYKRADQTDLRYYKKINLKNGSYEIGFVRKRYMKINGIFTECWSKDLLCLFFDKENVLIKQIFYNIDGIAKPQTFILREGK